MTQQGGSAITDRAIREIFADAADFNVRTITVGELPLTVYAIDGLTAGGDISQNVVRPLLEHLPGGTMQQMYRAALKQVVWNSVAVACRDLEDALSKLVNGFSLVLFDGAGCIAFETPRKGGSGSG